MKPSVLVLALGARLGLAAQLPSTHAEQPNGEHKNARWWARVHDRVYYAPSASMAELSQDVSNYYYALGAQSALTEGMKAHRVGGSDSAHIFHLPKGPSMLQMQSGGDRRTAFSSLVQLESGAQVGGDFPKYTDRKETLSSEAQQVEKSVLDGIQFESTVKDYLTRLLQAGNADGVMTRSWTDPDHTKPVLAFLQEEFAKLGLASCLQPFKQGGHDLYNVVAFLPKSAGGISERVAVLGAHYDSRPFEGAAPGAEDNGSGVAVMLAAAKAFMKMKAQLGDSFKWDRDVFFVGFAAEEANLLGSAHFAKTLAHGGAIRESLLAEGVKKSPNCMASMGGPMRKESKRLQGSRTALQTDQVAKQDQVVAIILDEVGWNSKNKNTINGESYDRAAPLLNSLAQAIHVTNVALEFVHSNTPFGSDHMSFSDQGWQSVLLINADDQEYPNYHKLTDTIENVDFEYAGKVAKFVGPAMVRLAAADASSGGSERVGVASKEVHVHVGEPIAA